MVVISKKWKKLSYKILTALGIGMLTSCYGMPIAGEFTFIEGDVTGIDEKPVEGIKVTLEVNKKKLYGFTDENGHYYIEVLLGSEDDIPAIITFEDIDGEENGSYEIKEKTITLSQYITTPVSVQMEEKKN